MTNLKNLKEVAHKTEKGWKRQILFPIVSFVLVIVTALVAGNYINHMTNMQSIELLRQSVRKAVVQCYAIEGAYPPDIDYLEKEYNLEYNHDKYYIDYEVFASNVMPNVDVYERE